MHISSIYVNYIFPYILTDVILKEYCDIAGNRVIKLSTFDKHKENIKVGSFHTGSKAKLYKKPRLDSGLCFCC